MGIELERRYLYSVGGYDFTISALLSVLGLRCCFFSIESSEMNLGALATEPWPGVFVSFSFRKEKVLVSTKLSSKISSPSTLSSGSRGGQGGHAPWLVKNRPKKMAAKAAYISCFLPPPFPRFLDPLLTLSYPIVLDHGNNGGVRHTNQAPSCVICLLLLLCT